jgi:uncharacterized FlgJ-related protein
MFYKFNQDTLEFQRVKPSTYVKGGLLVLAVAAIAGFSSSPRAVLKDLTPEEKIIVVREYNGFTQKALIEKIKSLNFKFPYIILAQSYQETGNYKSDIFLNGNNLFGMKEARIRATLAKGTNRNHAYYDSWQESLYDYALFYNTYLHDIKTEGEYYGYLQQYYAEDKSYVTRLKALIKKNNLKAKFN